MAKPDTLGDIALSGMAQCTPDRLAIARPVLEKIGERWTLLALTVVSREPKRFNEVRRSLDGITHKALADTLKRLVRSGLLTRNVKPTLPVTVEYAITPLGLSLRDPFQALCNWAIAHRDDMDRAAAVYDRDQQK